MVVCNTVAVSHMTVDSAHYYYCYYDVVVVVIIVVIVSCHRHFLPGTSLEPAAVPTDQVSSFRLQCFPYFV